MEHNNKKNDSYIVFVRNYRRKPSGEKKLQKTK